MNDAERDCDEELFYPEEKMTVWYYARPHVYEFLDYVSQEYEPILYTQSTQVYMDFISHKFDPENKFFRHWLYQNANFVMEKKDEDIKEFVKDIA